MEGVNGQGWEKEGKGCPGPTRGTRSVTISVLKLPVGLTFVAGNLPISKLLVSTKLTGNLTGSHNTSNNRPHLRTVRSTVAWPNNNKLSK